MKRKLFICCAVLSVWTLSIGAQSAPKDGIYGCYTITTISENVYHIEDSNADHIAGPTHNSSDMYLIVGTEKALLIDLSNKITWYKNPEKYLREVVYDRVGKKPLVITITHNHGDHVGMLPAFADDRNATFWLPASDFLTDTPASSRYPAPLFPKERVTYFENYASINLGGGYIINSAPLPGHTPGSTVLLFNSRNLLFIGDALGIWIFSTDGFKSFANGYPAFWAYIMNQNNGLDYSKILVFGGHFWQRTDPARRGIQFLYDMNSLIEKVSMGEIEPISTGYSFFPYLNAMYTFGMASITWNKEDADNYVREYRSSMGLSDDDFIGHGPTHKDKNSELIKLFDEYRFHTDTPAIGDMKYCLYDPTMHGADPNKKYPLIVVFHGANNGRNGVMCTSYTDCAVYAGKEYQTMMGGAYMLFPKANEAEQEDYPEYRQAGTWMTQDPATGTSIYIPACAAIIEKVVAEHSIDPERIIVGGTSAGGFMTWRFAAARPDLVNAAFLMAPADNPSDMELEMYDRMELPIWVIHGVRDEICKYEVFTGPVAEKLSSMKHVRLSPIPIVRYGDKGIVKMNVGGTEMGQHLALFCVGANMIYDDGTPYDTAFPDGFIAWLKESLNL